MTSTLSTTTLQRVMIVDNDAIMRDLMADGLRAAGYATACTPDAKGAAKILAGDPDFDLIILDLMMPTKHDVLFFLHLLRSESHPHTPIVVHTADAGATDEARQAGASRIIVKPVAWERFVTEIHQLLDS